MSVDPGLATSVGRALGHIDDPCLAAAGLPGSIVDLGLVQNISADSRGAVDVTVALTEMGCAFTHHLIDRITRVAEAVEGVTAAHVTTVWTWTPEQMDAGLAQRLTAQSDLLESRLGPTSRLSARLPIVTG